MTVPLIMPAASVRPSGAKATVRTITPREYIRSRMPVAGSQMLIPSPSGPCDAMARRLPSGEKAIDQTVFSIASKSWSEASVTGSTSASAPTPPPGSPIPMASDSPSGANANDRMGCPCGGSVRAIFQVVVSQRLTVLSSPPDAMILPSGANATAHTAPVCALIVAWHSTRHRVHDNHGAIPAADDQRLAIRREGAAAQRRPGCHLARAASHAGRIL